MSTSTGVEARFTMPVLNVPFRLIYAWNPNRDFYQPAHGVQVRGGDDLLRPKEKPVMKRAVLTLLPLLAVAWLGGCSSPTESDASSFDVTFTASPDPATATPSTGVQYKVTNADDTVSYYDYDYRTSFTRERSRRTPGWPWTSRP